MSDKAKDAAPSRDWYAESTRLELAITDAISALTMASMAVDTLVETPLSDFSPTHQWALVGVANALRQTTSDLNSAIERM